MAIRKKVYSIFGTRPEAIKMAILCQKLNEIQEIDHKIILTGQHKEMLYQVMDFFKIKADIDLEIMKQGQDLTDITSIILVKLRDLFLTEKPDLVLVHGDTTTSFAATLACFYQNIKVGHVEAGLRTNNLQSPFPEEANRTLTSKLASFHFAPTNLNLENLNNEGIYDNIFVTGNTVIDSLIYSKNIVTNFSDKVDDDKLRNVFESNDKKILVTGHRRENFGEGFLNICKGLIRVATNFPDIQIVYPVHLNPNVQGPVNEMLKGIKNIVLTKPLDYSDFIFAMKNSFIILTDSGGIQEEAPSLGKPVLVMRDTTERPEAIKAGTVKLVGANEESIFNGICEMINDEFLYDKMSHAHNPYGSGDSSGMIVNIIVNKILVD